MFIKHIFIDLSCIFKENKYYEIGHDKIKKSRPALQS